MNRPDVADQMVRGGRRPSTYHGTIAISFSTRPRPAADFEKKVQEKRKRGRLVVRLHRGLYLPERYRKKKVSVIVQMAGCFLPDSTTSQLLHDAKGDAKKEKDILNKKGKFNRSLLSFPGEVDADGVLTFTDFKAENLQDLKNNETEYAWIQRSTPRKHTLMIPPDVRHAYIYIVEDTQEDVPPGLWSRIRLHYESERPNPEGFADDYHKRQQYCEEALNRPRWKRVRFDTSVSEPPESVFKDDFGGFILGSAYVTGARPQEEKEAESSSRPDAVEGEAEAAPATAPVTPKIDREFPSSPIIPDDDEKKYEGKRVRIRTENPQDKKVFPRGSMPQSIMCRPCMGETYVNVGSAGDPDELYAGLMADDAPDSKGEFKMGKVIMMADVICARSLKATDEDGLCDPCYRIMVEDRILNSYENGMMNVAKSLNPYYMHRVKIPVQVPLPLNAAGETSINEDELKKNALATSRLQIARQRLSGGGADGHSGGKNSRRWLGAICRQRLQSDWLSMHQIPRQPRLRCAS